MSISSGNSESGRLLLGKYRIEKVLGEGGMGIVVEAVHIRLNQRVAIKFLQAQNWGKKEQQEEHFVRFLREARAASRIQSEHVARVTDVGEMENGAPYMIMEFLEGQDLEQVLKARGPLPIAEACSYMMQACEALVDAHDLEIVHRDIKPANLFLTYRINSEPIIKVLDFGIAKVNDGFQTKSSAGMGTLNYMPPEQLNNTKQVDARSDIWALGVTLFELLTGRTPFDSGSGDMVEILRRIEAAIPAYYLRNLRSDIPDSLEQIVHRCLEKEPNRRFQSSAELIIALAPFSTEQGAHSLRRIRKNLERSGSLPIPQATPSDRLGSDRQIPIPQATPSDHLSSDGQIHISPLQMEGPAPALDRREDILCIKEVEWASTLRSSKLSRRIFFGSAAFILLIGVAFQWFSPSLDSLMMTNPQESSLVSPTISSAESVALNASALPVASSSSYPTISWSTLPIVPTVPFNSSFRTSIKKGTGENSASALPSAKAMEKPSSDIDDSPLPNPYPKNGKSVDVSVGVEDSPNPYRRGGIPEKSSLPSTTGVPENLNCNPPYTLQNGIKKYKPICLTDGR